MTNEVKSPDRTGNHSGSEPDSNGLVPIARIDIEPVDARDQASGALAEDGVSLPEGFVRKADGIYQGSLWVSDDMRVPGKARDFEGRNFSLLVTFQNPDGQSVVKVIPMSQLSGSGNKVRSEFQSSGLRINETAEGRQAFSIMLNDMAKRASSVARIANRIGWHKEGTEYVLPGRTFGGDGEPVIFQSGGAVKRHFDAAGTLSDWQANVGAMCEGNSRLVLAVSAAFAAPLLSQIGIDGGGVHLVGDSSVGKSTALRVGSSVCGRVGNDGYTQTWRHTACAIESVAESRNDAALYLDEIGEADPGQVGSVSYMLGNGAGKARGRSDGSIQRAKTFTVMVMSAGEETIAARMAQAGKRPMRGQEVRLADLPGDAGAGMGLFENLHGAESPAAFADNLKSATSQYYGTALPAFLDHLTQSQGDAVIKSQSIIKDFVDDVRRGGMSASLGRIAKRFGVIAAGGELATDFGIVPWAPGEAIKAARICFEAHRQSKLDVLDVEVGLSQAMEWLRREASHQLSRFPTEDSPGTSSDPGYFRPVGTDDSASGLEYLVAPATFRAEICGQHSVSAVSNILKQAGVLIPGTGGDRLTTKITIPGVGRRDFYVLRLSERVATVVEPDNAHPEGEANVPVSHQERNEDAYTGSAKSDAVSQRPSVPVSRCAVHIDVPSGPTDTDDERHCEELGSWSPDGESLHDEDSVAELDPEQTCFDVDELDETVHADDQDGLTEGEFLVEVSSMDEF